MNAAIRSAATRTPNRAVWRRTILRARIYDPINPRQNDIAIDAVLAPPLMAPSYCCRLKSGPSTARRRIRPYTFPGKGCRVTDHQTASI